MNRYLQTWLSVGFLAAFGCNGSPGEVREWTPGDHDQPAGHWIALPMQVYRINTLFLSTKGMQRAGVTRSPTSSSRFASSPTACTLNR